MEKIDQKFKKILESKAAVKILYTIGIVIVVLVIFSAGMATGFRKASFGRAWDEHYNENFGIGHRQVRMGSMMGEFGMMDYFPNSHGAIGKIIKIEPANIIVEDKDNTEKIVLITDSTQIQKVRENIQKADLKIDDFVVVIGSPNDKGQIEAKFIRVMPSPDVFFNEKIQ